MTHTASSLHDAPGFHHKLAETLRDPALRIGRLEHDGATYWVKKEEKLSLRYRLQKGDPHRAFKADRTAMQALADQGVPVPRVVAEGDGYFVMEDCGRPLSQMLCDRAPTDDTLAAFAAAGRVLAETHAKHLSHGRPSIKDMCWQDGQLTLLDFERNAQKRNTPKGHMQDLIVFVHSCFAFAGEDRPEITAAISAYRAADRLGTWEKTCVWCHKMRWVNWVTKPIQWRKPGRAREFKAIPLTLHAFGVG